MQGRAKLHVNPPRFLSSNSSHSGRNPGDSGWFADKALGRLATTPPTTCHAWLARKG